MYPVLTTLIMMIFFREKKSAWRFFAIALAVVGVCWPFLRRQFRWNYCHRIVHRSPVGFWICALPGYGESTQDRKQMKGLTRLTFYVFLFGTRFPLVGIGATTGIQVFPDWHTGGNLLLLALIPTVISNLALVQAVKESASRLFLVLKPWSR